jgi:hypothetical protein
MLHDSRIMAPAVKVTPAFQDRALAVDDKQRQPALGLAGRRGVYLSFNREVILRTTNND